MKIKTQPDDYSCGIYSIINALMVYGEELSRKKVGALTQTTKDGTDENKLQKALTELGYKTKPYSTKNPDYAWRWVLNHASKEPMILYMGDDHWLVVAGRVRNKVILLDSWDKAQIVGKQELLEAWKKKEYWGMTITIRKNTTTGVKDSP